MELVKGVLEGGLARLLLAQIGSQQGVFGGAAGLEGARSRGLLWLLEAADAALLTVSKVLLDGGEGL